MFELLVPFVAVSSLGWALVCALRGDRPVAVGAGVMGLLLMGAWAAAGTSAWAEGGPEMNVVALTGSYGLGAATAFRFSGGRGAKFAAMVSATLAALFAGYFYFHGLQELEEVLRGVTDPSDEESIRAGSRGELTRLLQLASALVIATAVSLAAPRRPNQSRAGLTGEAARSAVQHEA